MGFGIGSMRSSARRLPRLPLTTSGKPMTNLKGGIVGTYVINLGKLQKYQEEDLQAKSIRFLIVFRQTEY